MKLPLERAVSLLARRKFNDCLRVLENSADLYRDVFSYYLTGGLACLYLNEFGSANRYFQMARRYNVTDPQLLLGQAVLYLRVGDTARAVQYYLDVQEQDPKNRTARRGLAFIKEKGTPEEIFRLVESGAIRMLYPPLGANPTVVVAAFFALLLAGGAVASLVLLAPAIERLRPTEIRFDKSTEFLRAEDYAVDLDSLKSATAPAGGSGGDLPTTEREIERSYRAAYSYATEPVNGDETLHRTNMARHEANRLIASPAVDESLKAKARGIIDAMDADRGSEPTFSTLLDNFPCERVVQNPVLYDGCWVLWPGHLFNGRTEDGVYKCSFFVSDDEQSRILGIFDMTFGSVPSEPITGDRALDVLARISVGEGPDGRPKVTLEERQYAVHLRDQSAVQSRNAGAETK